jgi:uncharacterized membrane protein
MLKNWNTDKIIGAGLILALLFLILGNIIVILYTGKFPTTDLPMNIVTGLAGYMGRSLLEKSKKEDELK